MLLLTLRGTPTLYYGDEIGMRDVPDPPEPRPRTRGSCNLPGRGLGRDPERTPMQWDASPRRGLHDGASRGCPVGDRHRAA
jgi:alpha-glucosidase